MWGGADRAPPPAGGADPDPEPPPPEPVGAAPGRPAKAAAGGRPARDKGDPPLFERSDFEALLNPALHKAKPGETAEAPVVVAPAPAANPAPAETLRQGLPVADDGVYVSRSTAVMLGGLGLVLLALAFAAGYLVGAR